jgi:D-alanyl-D-alanine carboxypeptidase (penicillin-binding protein 5/6)
MEWGFAAWQVKPLYKARASVGEAQVQLGSESSVPLVTPRAYSLTMPAGILSKVTATKIRYQGPIKAPIKKGDHVADLVVTTSDMGEQVMPLVAGEDVGEAGFFGRAWIGLKQLLGLA